MTHEQIITTAANDTLTHLARLHEACFKPDSTARDRVMFQDALTSHIYRVRVDTDKAVVETLIQYSFEYLDVRIKAERPTHLDICKLIDASLGALLQHGMVASCVEDEAKRKMLGWMCLSRIATYETQAFHATDQNILNVLCQWSGKSVSSILPMRFENTVHLLYGPGVWDLYAADVDNNLKVPNHLYLQGLTALSQKNLTPERDSEVTVDLPSNL